MKRIIIFALAFSLLFAFSACGKLPQSGIWIPEESETESAPEENTEKAAQETTVKQVSPLSLKDIAPEKILTVYFDPRGSAGAVADLLAGELGCEAFELVTIAPYPEDESELVEKANNEYENILYPALEAMPEKAGDYEVIIAVFPEIGGNMPMAVRFFLESFDLRFTALVPVCVCEGLAPAYGMAQFRSLMSGCPVYGGLEIMPEDDILTKCGEWLVSELK